VAGTTAGKAEILEAMMAERHAADPIGHERFVTIDYFIKEMLGYKSRITYYNHLNDPGWPQRVYPAGKPMLVYDECVAYQQQLMSERKPPPGPFTKAVPPGGKKRHPGRPAKVAQRAS
jgi:hypothetical protein